MRLVRRRSAPLKLALIRMAPAKSGRMFGFSRRHWFQTSTPCLSRATCFLLAMNDRLPLGLVSLNGQARNDNNQSMETRRHKLGLMPYACFESAEQETSPPEQTERVEPRGPATDAKALNLHPPLKAPRREAERT